MISGNSHDVTMSTFPFTLSTIVPTIVSDVDTENKTDTVFFTTTAISNNKTGSWCDDLQGGDFIYSPTLHSPTIRNVVAVAFILLMVITVLGNSIVIIIFVTARPLRRITSTLVVSMAVADILVALCGELQCVIMMLSSNDLPMSDVLCEFFTSADLYFSLSELLHIVSLAGDRYLVICYPFKYERVGRKYLIVAMVTTWTLPVLFSFLPIMVHWHRIGLEDLYNCLHNLEVHICTLFPNKGFSTVSFLVMFALPSGLMCYCYFHIYRVATSQRKRMGAITLGAYCDMEDFVEKNLVISGSPIFPKRPSIRRKPPSSFKREGSTKEKNPPHAEDETVFIQLEHTDSEPTLSSENNNESPSDEPPTFTRKISIRNRDKDNVKPVNETIALMPLKRKHVGMSEPNGTVVPPNSTPIPRRHQQDAVRKKRSRSFNTYRVMFLGEDFRAARSISIVFICFAITWSPYWITILIMPYLGPNKIPDPLIGASIWLAYFGSALNPFVYYFSNRAIKRGLRRLIRKLLYRFGHHNHVRSNSFP